MVRIFNAAGDASAQKLGIGFEAEKIELVELDGRVIEELKPSDDASGNRSVSLQIPRFGVRTLRFREIKPSRQ